MVSSANPFNLEANDPFDYYKTMNIHGDAHLENIFCSLTGERISLIDNASMPIWAKHPGSILIDIARIFTYQVNYLNPASIQAAIYREGYKAFFKGYIRTYPVEQQPYLQQYIAALVGGNYPDYFTIKKERQQYAHYKGNKDRMAFSKIIADYIRSLSLNVK